MSYPYPLQFPTIYIVFYVSMLRWYIPHESHVFWQDLIQWDNRLTFVEKVILARDVRRLWSRDILIVIVKWRHHLVKKDTRVIECGIWAKLPSSVFGFQSQFTILNLIFVRINYWTKTSVKQPCMSNLTILIALE